MKRAVIILIHTGYWCMYLLLLFVMYLLLAASQEQLIQDFSQGLRMWFRAMAPLAILPGILGFYAGYSWLYPAYIAKRRIGFFFLMAILSAIVASVVGIGFMHLMYLNNEVKTLEWDAYSIMGIIMSLMAAINLVIGVVIRGFINSYQDILVKEELTRQNTKVELALVKSQINPHFLFNTLNNIDVLIESDPQKASAFLHKLSDIMRFMLYEAKDEKIPLATELEYIDRYIELQRIRTTISDYVVVEVEGNPHEVLMEPMMFLPFIENAFKYAEHRKEHEAVIVKWKIQPDSVSFYCENTFSPLMKEHHAQKEGGLGNELIQKRLLLLYPHKHTLRCTEKEQRFIVELNIELS